MKNNINKIIIFLIIIALIVVGIFVYNNKDEEEIICTVDGDSAINATTDNGNVTNIVNSEANNSLAPLLLIYSSDFFIFGKFIKCYRNDRTRNT